MNPHRKMLPKEKVILTSIIQKTKGGVIYDPEILKLSKLYSDIFGTRPIVPCRCDNKIIVSWLNMLTKISKE